MDIFFKTISYGYILSMQLLISSFSSTCFIPTYVRICQSSIQKILLPFKMYFANQWHFKYKMKYREQIEKVSEYKLIFRVTCHFIRVLIGLKSW